MPIIQFKADDLRHEAACDEWLYDVCVDAKASIPFACKAGACGTCATEVLEGYETLGTPSQREVRTLTAHKLDPARFRLPCLGTVKGDLTFGQSARMLRAKKLAVFEAEVESYRPLNLTVCEIRFYVKEKSFDFRPGQYVIFQIPTADEKEIIRRSYSISTTPRDRSHFEICVRAVAGGHGSNFVHRLRAGDKVKYEGPMGDFALKDSEKDILMVATGTGIGPIKSMLLHLLETRSNRRVRLFFGVRTVGDLFYTDFLRGLAAHYPSFSYEITLSQPDPTQWAGPRGRVTELVRQHVIVEDGPRSEAYLCGSRQMVDDVTALLLARGFDKDDIRTETFY